MDTLSYSNYSASSAPVEQKGITPTARKASQGQISYYMDTCKQKGITQKENAVLTALSYEDMSTLLQSVLNHYPASDKQKETIVSACEAMKALPPSVEILSSLSSKQASAMIKQLFEKQKEFQEVMELTDEQVTKLIEMFLCPAVDFESIGVPSRIMLDAYNKNSKGELVQQWMLPPVQDTVDALKEALNKQTAHEFIGKHKAKFAEWRKTRLKLYQEERIRKLEKRLATISGKAQYAEDVIDIEGITFTLEFEGSEPKDKNITNAYTPLTQDVISMFTQDGAKEYIAMLEDEAVDATLTAHSSEGFDDDVLEMLKSIKNTSDLASDEGQKLEQFLHNMLSVAGYEDEDLISAYIDLDVDGTEPNQFDVRKRYKIRSFIQDLVESKYIDMFSLLSMAKHSAIAWDIIIEGVESKFLDSTLARG